MISHEIVVIGALWLGLLAFALGAYFGCKLAAADNSLLEIENNNLRGTNRRAMHALKEANKQQADAQEKLDRVLECRKSMRHWN